MLVEITGVSSAGKTTLIQKILDASPENVLLREAAIAEHLHTKRVGSYAIRTAVEDLAAAAALAREPRLLAQLVRSIRAASKLMPDSIGAPERLNRLRNAFRHIGMTRFLAQRDRPDRVVILDTGPIHTAHNLFIHLEHPVDETGLNAYLDAIPLADAAIILTADAETIVERTLARGHRRLQAGSADDARRFTNNALRVFEVAASHERIRSTAATYRTIDHAGDLEHLPARVRELIESTH